MINNLIIFDGDCGFCNYYINLLISHDKKSIFKFTSFGSALSIETLEESKFNQSYRDSIILVMDGKTYTKSSAILSILKRLGPLWKIVGITLQYLIPKIVRDYLYTLFASNRYIISKKYNSCRLPQPGDMDRFI